MSVRRLLPGLGFLVLVGCGADSEPASGMKTTTFFVKEMGEELRIL